MKKKLLVALCIFALSFTFAACGGKDMSGSPYLGTWTATTGEYSGIEISLESALGGPFIFDLGDNGKCKMTVAGEEETGSWDETEDGFIVEDTLTFTVDGDNAFLDYEGVIITFVRQ